MPTDADCGIGIRHDKKTPYSIGTGSCFNMSMSLANGALPSAAGTFRPGVPIGRGGTGIIAFPPRKSRVARTEQTEGPAATVLRMPGVVARRDTEGAHALLTGAGTVIASGDRLNGGDTAEVAHLLVDVVALFATNYAFAALRRDGTVVSWGERRHGGDSSRVAGALRDVATIVPSQGAFAALRRDGSVVAWGERVFGGDCSAVADVLSGVTAIHATGFAFAALRDDGSVVTWGGARFGGDSSAVAGSLTGITAVTGKMYAFTATRSDGRAVAWGWRADRDGAADAAARRRPAPVTIRYTLLVPAPVARMTLTLQLDLGSRR